jgi:hypothetical protein
MENILTSSGIQINQILHQLSWIPNAMISRFHATILLIGWTATSPLYATPIPAADRQAAASQGDANKQLEPAKSAPRPNPDASGTYHRATA